MTYYYADCFTEADGSKAPGKDTGAGLESAQAVLPPACSAVHFDRTRTPERFVLVLDPRWPTPLPGWEAKTAAEVEADYPGLLGGA